MSFGNENIRGAIASFVSSVDSLKGEIEMENKLLLVIKMNK